MNVKIVYAKVLWLMAKIAGVDAAKKFDARLRFHKKLNLKRPKTLSEKVAYIELHCQSPLASSCTDKYAVREYVISKGLGEMLVPLVGGPWTDVNDVDFESLPDRFVLKATHGCKMNYLVANKSAVDRAKCRKEMKRWLSTTYGSYSMEPHYLRIPHRIYAEQFLGDKEPLIDYKFHCMDGVPQFVLVCSDRKANGDAAMKVTLDLFDMDWKQISELVACGAEVPGDGTISKPELFEEMKRVSQVLSADFKFVRVDLCEWNGRIYFGELTFSPANCVFPYFTAEFDAKMGTKLNL